MCKYTILCSVWSEGVNIHLFSILKCCVSYSIDEGLVQEESPYKSSREFGVSYATSAGIAAVGTVMRIQDFAKVGNDGVLLISNTGESHCLPRSAWSTDVSSVIQQFSVGSLVEWGPEASGMHFTSKLRVSTANVETIAETDIGTVS